MMSAVRRPRSVIVPRLWLAAVLLLVGGVARAEPRTLYKLQDVENARRNLERYGWAQRIVDAWKRSVAFALEQDREFFDELIPDLTPGSYYGQNCPACVGKQSVMGESGVFQWSVSASDEITCRRCGTVYPNDEYRETGTLDCPRMGQTFTYYETPDERADPERRAEHALKWLGKRPTMTSFSGMIRYAKVKWAWGQALTLAKLYAVTGEIAYAERAAWILDRFARVFPGYLYHSYDGSYADWPPADVAANMGEHGGGGRLPTEAVRHAYGLNQHGDHARLYNGFWGAGRLSVHGKGSDAGPLLDLTIAYDLIGDARDADGRRVLQDGAARRIRDDLIAAGCADIEHWNDVSNKGVAAFALSAAVGILLEQPERVRFALGAFDRVMDERYHFDGFYSESPGYAAHNFSNMRELPDLLDGYSDPAGYRPASGERLENLSPFAAGRVHLALQAMVRMLAPGNRLPTIGDTGYDTRLSPLYAEVLAARSGGAYAGLLETLQGAALSEKGSEYSLWYRPCDLEAPPRPVELPLRSEWFPGWHVAVLRGGRPAGDTALYLNGNEHRWTRRTGHRQRDILSLSYFAFGEELASDRGYFSGSGQLTRDGRSGQSWIRSTRSHNLVVVDEQDQATRQCGSNLELFGVAPCVEVVEASAVDAYAQCETYRRTCALVVGPRGQSYVVDFFRVKGGVTHQYSFHANGSLVGVTPAEPAPQPIELGEAWDGWLNNARAFAPEAPRRFTWRFRNVSLDLLSLNDRDTVDRVIVADAPGWRKGSPASELEKPPIQQFLAEHRAADPEHGAATEYAAVIAAYESAPSPVVAAHRLAAESGGAMAVEVQLDGRTDYIISAQDHHERQFGPVRVAGRFAFVSVDDQGRALEGYLLGGTRLTCGALDMRLPEPSTTLEVRSVSERTYHLAKPAPPGVAVPGSYLLAAGAVPLSDKAPRPQTGFEIESATADSITVRDYPVVACEKIEVLRWRWVRLKP